MDTMLFAAHHDLEVRHWWFCARRRAIRELGLRLVPDGGRIVDVGCGTGADIASYPPSFERYGIDWSPEAITFARSRYPEVEFELGSVPEDGRDAIAAALWHILRFNLLPPPAPVYHWSAGEPAGVSVRRDGTAAEATRARATQL